MAKAKNIAFSLRLIRWFCREELIEEIEGNLLEYRERNQEKSWSTFRYWFQVLHYLRPSTIKKVKSNSNTGPMFIINPLQSLRVLTKHGISAVINIAGFTTGLICVIFLFFYISEELSYDNFHEDKDNIYRVIRIGSINETSYDIGVTSAPFGPALLEDFDQTIYDACRVQMPFGESRSLVTFADKKFMEERIIFTDPNFFRFFSFELISGDPQTVLQNPNQIVISASLAEKYFPKEDPIGKTIHIDLDDAFTISGIFRDVDPLRSHFDFDMVGNVHIFDDSRWFNHWWSNNLITYVKVNSAIEAEGLEAQFPSFMDKYFLEDFERTGTRIDLKLEPLADTYFNHETRYDTVKHGNLETLRILVWVGIAILLIASFNYVNLSIAFSFQRAKEVGVRKVLGAHQKRLMLQFIGESLFVLACSFLLAGVLSALLRPWINQVFDLQVSYRWTDPDTWIFLISLMILLITLSAIYPALLMSNFNPLKILNGKKPSMGKGLNLRRALVVLQFAISIFMIAATLLILSQLDFIQNKDLGFNKDAVMVVANDNRDIRTNADLFKSEILNSPHIRNVSSMSGEPGGFHDATVIEMPGLENLVRMRTLWTDYHYLETLDAKLFAGSGFNEELQSQDNAAVLINQSGLREIGLPADDVIGKPVSLPSLGAEGKLIGIVEDFHFSSLHDDIEPLVMVLSNRQHSRYAISLRSENLFDGIRHIESVWSKYSPMYPIKYEFLDDSLDQLYENEVKQGRVFTAFAMLSVVLACIGVFGLVSHTARQRQKELSIRKVLGADLSHLIKLLSKEYLMVFSLAILVSIPVAWWFLQRWLETFAYRINLGGHWPVFLISGAITIILAFLTIAFRTYRSALSSPLDSIKYE